MCLIVQVYLVKSNGDLSLFGLTIAHFPRRTNENLGREEEEGATEGLSLGRASIILHLSLWEPAENHWFRGFTFSQEKILSSIFY